MGYHDINYARDIDGRKSADYILICANSPISWQSTLPSVIALSTPNVEYIVVTEAMERGIMVKKVYARYCN